MPGFDLRRRATRSAAARVGLAAIAMVVAAEAARQAIGAGREPLEPLPVAVDRYFDQRFLESAREYRSGQLRLAVAATGAQAAVLLALALGRPAVARRALSRLATRPVLGGAAAGAGIAIVVAVVALPPRVAAHERAVEVGLSTQGLGEWFWDAARSGGLTVVFAAAGSALLLALIRRWPRGWWAPGAGAAIAIAIAFAWIAPVVLGPIFNRFEPLPEGSPVRAQVLELAERADVDIGEVYSVDASRRSTRESAYVDGLGPTRRVVLYDNLIEAADRPELRAVVAHELAHVAHADVPRGLAFVAIVAPFGLLLTRELGGAIARRAGAPSATPASLPAYLLALALAATVLGIGGNQLSRDIEASADTFALELTRDAEAMVDLQVRLADANLSDPDPPAAVRFLLRTHPTTIERIGIARAYERARGDEAR